MAQFQPRILITGETAGTGTSTASKLLATILQLPTISGGRYQRALAYAFQKADNYKNFLKQYTQCFQKYGLDKTTELFADFLDEKPRSEIVAGFQAAIEYNQHETGKTDSIWDYLVDQNTIKHALAQDGFIWEAKLAILVLDIDQLQSVIPQNNEITIAPFRVLLSVDPQIAADRVSERENRQVDTAEILLRKQRDFDRYGNLYTIGNKKITHADLQKNAELHIITDHKNPDQVVAEIIANYIEKLNQNSASEEASQIIAKLTSATQNK